MNFKLLDPPHQDLVNDIAFDYYGKRFATCSSDKHIKVWSLNEEKQSWTSDDITRAHQDSIWRLTWAHPEFGQLIASCSEDNTIKIWEEQELGYDSANRWTRKATISNSRRSVNDVKFSHRALGLKLAAASADGFVRIYESRDIFDLSHWDLYLEYQVEDTTAPLDGGSSVPTHRTSLSSQQNLPQSRGYPSEHGLTCIGWNDCQFEPPRIVVGGFSKKAIVFRIEGTAMSEECVLGSHNSAISDVAWAPDMGRSFHLIATASREPTFKIHTLKRFESGGIEYESTESLESPSKTNIWRLSWNATGTVLAAAAEDGSISLWRKNFSGNWINVQNIPSDNKMSYFYSQV